MINRIKYFMKVCLVLSFFFLSIETSLAQVATWKKQSLAKFSLQSNEMIAGDNLKMSEIAMSGRKYENLLMMKGNTSYSTSNTGEGEKWRLVKETNGTETSVDFKVGGSGHVINKEGFVVVDDFSHGAGGIFEFYSPDLKKINTYKPFPSSYQMMQISSYEDRVCIYTIKTYNSASYKIALLDKTGNLIVEKEYTIGRHGALKIKMSRERIILTFEVFELNSNKYNTKIVAFNTDLTQAWEKTYTGAIGYGETLNPKTNTLVFIHNNIITCLNEKNGEVKWALNSNTIGNGNQKLIFQAEHTQDGEALIVNLSFYNNQLKKYDENILAILNPSTGKIEFKEAQGGSSENLKIIPIGDKFILIKDSQILDFSKMPKQ